MSDDHPDHDAAPGDEDLLRRAAREIRATPSLRAFAPLSADERAALVDAALGAAGEPDLAVTPIRARRKRLVFAAGGALAVAAAAVLWLRATGTAPSIDPLVHYELAVEGEKATRGTASAEGVVELRPDTRLALRLTAPTVERDALIRVVLVRGARARLLEPTIARGRDGAIAIEARAGELLGPQADGAAELVVLLGRALPSDDDVRAIALGGDAPAHVQVLRRALALVGFSHGRIEVELGGCAAIVAGATPRCELGDRPLQLWVAAPHAELALDDQPWPATPIARAEGTSFALGDARPGTLRIAVAGEAIATWQLASSPQLPRVRAADEARRADRLDDAAALLAAVTEDAPAEEQLEATRQRAKLARRRGDAQAERRQRERAVELARQLGRVSVEADETVALLYGLRDAHAFSRAVQLLPTLDAPSALYAEGNVRRALAQGVIASELGELGTALAAYQRAVVAAERIADDRDRALALGPLAGVLQSLGRDGEARALVDAEVARGDRDGDPCARVDALTSAAWLLRDTARDRARDLAARARDLAVGQCGRLAAIALVNQGWIAAAAGQLGDARRALDELAALPGPRDARVATWTVRLEAEILLGEDPARAVLRADQLAQRAQRLCSSELAYEAHLLRARALVQLARPVDAAAAFASAETALTVWSRLVPLGEGRDSFFERHDQLALTAIPFFLAQLARGDPAARVALAATVRRSLARFVTSLAHSGQARTRAEQGADDRDRAQLAQLAQRWSTDDAAALPDACALRDAAARESPPALGAPPAHAALFIHPAPTGWLVLAWRGTAIATQLIDRVVDEPAEALAARLETAAAAMLAGAPRVHLYVHRAIAALPLDRRLAARLGVPVAFAVDARDAPPAICREAPRALVVSNPRRDLWAASQSAPIVRDALARRGFVVEVLEGERATRAAITARLADPCVALLHYDGHGASATGADRVDDALLLAGTDVLTAAQVLALPRVPPQIVLNGCTTAAPEGLGLAQAFALAGATRVIAALSDVAAGDAADFTRRLYDDSGESQRGWIDVVALFARAVQRDAPGTLRAFER